MHGLYFAYGSNLCSERLRTRVASAEALGAARLAGRRLSTDKRGRDGSGKANLRADTASSVWGALYRIDPAGWPALDAFELGYARIEVEVELVDGGNRRVAWSYASELLTQDPVVFDWYKRLMLDGAREHGLPREWVALLEALPERRDPSLS